MEERSELFSVDSASKFLKKNFILVVLVLGGLIMMLVGGMQFFSKPTDSGIEFVPVKNDDEAKRIFVDISGAVKNPGVFEFSSGSRISDAIGKAGGLTDDANVEYIGRNVNQAQVLSDGMKLYLPFDGEEVDSVLGSNSDEANGLVNLNSASQNMLEDLPRVGPVTAEKIIAGRPYDEVDDLLIRKIVGASTFEQIKDLVIAP